MHSKFDQYLALNNLLLAATDKNTSITGRQFADNLQTLLSSKELDLSVVVVENRQHKTLKVTTKKGWFNNSINCIY